MRDTLQDVAFENLEEQNLNYYIRQRNASVSHCLLGRTNKITCLTMQ